MQTTYYTVYRTTNNIDSKTYVGKHQTKDLNDKYLGSGKYLQRAINKYGKENFIKEILHVFDNEADMNAKEKELVTEEFVLLETNYNLCVGGQGGFSYINRACLSIPFLKGNDISGFKYFTEEERKLYSSKGGTAKAALVASGEIIPHDAWNKGKELSSTHKDNIGAANKGKQTGSSNSQYGKRFKWMSKELVNKKVKLDQVEQHLNDDWIFGRIKVCSRP